MKLHSSTKIVALLALLVVSSGCAGTISNPTDSTTSTANTTTRVSTATGSTTTTNASTTGPIYDLPLSNDELADGNENALREAGSFTAVEHYYLHSVDSTNHQWINTTMRADVETGRLYQVQNISGTTGSESGRTYVTKSGAGYHRTSSGNGYGVTYSRSKSSDLLSSSLRPDLTEYVENTRFDYRGVETLDGTKTYYYVASNLSAFTADENGTVVGLPREKLTNASVKLYVTDDGLLKRFDVHFVVQTTKGKIEGRMVSTYRNVGTTTVKQPSWLPRAKESVSTTHRTNPSETVTRTVHDDSLGAEVTVTGPRYAIDDVDIERQTGGFFDTDGEGFRKAQISALVRVRTSDRFTSRELALSYDDSNVSSENKDVVIYQFDWDIQTFVPLSTTVDANDNVAHADIDEHGTYLVMNRSTWESMWE